jgi:hypothetical protein
MCVRILAALLILVPYSHLYSQPRPDSIDNIPVLSVCEALQNRMLYNDKSIIVIGEFSPTDEGAWLKDDCEQTVITDGFAWSNSISLLIYPPSPTPPPPFPNNFIWNDELLIKKLKTLRSYGRFRSFSMWIAVFGRLETKILPEIYKDGSGLPKGLGFGHLGGSLAQLVSPTNELHSLKEKEPDLIPAQKQPQTPIDLPPTGNR